MMTGPSGKPIWQRGGRVEKLPLMFTGQDTPAGALKHAAEEMRKAAEGYRATAQNYLKWANEKDKQAAEIEEAVRKLEGKP